MIVYPIPYKSFEDMLFGELKFTWNNVKYGLSDCDEVVAIGFSFNDPHFTQTLIESLMLNKKNPVIKAYNPKEIDDSDFRASGINFEQFLKKFNEFSPGNQ